MNVILTGAAGFLGYHCLNYWLKTTDWRILCVDSLQHRGRIDRIQPILDSQEGQSRLAFLQVDLAGPTDTVKRQMLTARNAFLGGTVDIIVNTASDSHVDRSVSQPVKTWTNNVLLIANMMEIARECSPWLQWFFQTSSDEVYGPARNDQRHKEWSTIIPSNPYSASKAAQEALCISYWRTYGIKIAITNTMNLVGQWQDPEKYLPKIIKCIREQRPVPIHGQLGFDKQPLGFGSRFYVHAENYASAISFLVKNTHANYFPMHERPSRYNIVGETELDNMQLAQRVAAIMGKPDFKYEVVDFHQTRPGHDRRYALDGSLLASLGWSPHITFDSSLPSIVQWFLDHPLALNDYEDSIHAVS